MINGKPTQHQLRLPADAAAFGGSENHPVPFVGEVAYLRGDLQGVAFLDDQGNAVIAHGYRLLYQSLGD